MLQEGITEENLLILTESAVEGKSESPELDEFEEFMTSKDVILESEPPPAPEEIPIPRFQQFQDARIGLISSLMRQYYSN